MSRTRTSMWRGTTTATHGTSWMANAFPIGSSSARRPTTPTSCRTGRRCSNLAHVIGDFTWTGWDYLGEVGLGRVSYGEDSGLLMGDYPWLAAWCADIDITGRRRALSYLRETVFGLRSEPHVSVQDPGRHGITPTHLGLSGEPWLEGLASWSWPGFEGHAVTVDVMSDADDVELLVNGVSVGKAAGRSSDGFRTTFETTFEPGEIVAIAYRDGTEVARTALQSGTGLVGIDVRADRTQIRADDTDLAYIEITLVDGDGRRAPHRGSGHHGRGRRSPASYWVWAAPTLVQKRRSGSPPTIRIKDEPLPSCDRLRRARSPSS